MTATAYCPGCKGRVQIRGVIGPGVFCVPCGNFLGNDLAKALALQPVARPAGTEPARPAPEAQPQLPFASSGGAA